MGRSLPNKCIAIQNRHIGPKCKTLIWHPLMKGVTPITTTESTNYAVIINEFEGSINKTRKVGMEQVFFFPEFVQIVKRRMLAAMIRITNEPKIRELLESMSCVDQNSKNWQRKGTLNLSVL